MRLIIAKGSSNRYTQRKLIVQKGILMEYNTSALCDIYLDQVDVVEPMFSNFGGRTFAGQISTLKCFEDNALIRSVLEQDGLSRVFVNRWWRGSLRKSADRC